MAKRNELKWGSALSYAQMTLNIIIGLVYTPIMIRLLGKNEYGLYNTVSSTISMLSVLSLGFNAGYIRYFAKYRRERNEDKISSLNGLFLLLFLVIGVVAFVCGIFLTTNLELVFDEGLTAEEYETARILMLLLTVNLSLSFPMSVFATIISANERFFFLKLIGMVKTVLGPMVNLPLLLMGFRSVGLVTSSLVFNIITDGIFIYYVLYRLSCRFVFRGIEKGLFKSLFGFTFFIALNLIVDQINNNIDRLLLGRFIGTAEVAVYAVGANLYTHYMSISTAVSGVFTPRIHHIYNQYQNKEQRNSHLSELFIKIGRIQFLILMLFASGIVIFGRAFIGFWVGDGYERAYYVILLIMIPASVPLIQNIGIEIQRAANQHQFRSIVYIGMALANLILTIFLCQLYGAVGAAFGTCVSVAIANGIVMNIYYYKMLGIDIPMFWRNILRIMVGMLPAFLLGAAIMLFVRMNSIWVMLVYVVAYTVVYCVSVWLLAMNRFEKDMVMSPVRKVLTRVAAQIGSNSNNN